MLQFIAERNERYSISEQVKMATDSGCAWVQLCLPDITDAETKELTDTVVPMCREAGIILTIEDNAELAQQLGLHGVHLTNSEANARQMRQDLGAEAIIGINITSAQGVPTLAKLDIDYVTVAPQLSAEQAAEIVNTVRAVGCDMPIVLTGEFDCLDIMTIRNAGVNGVATGRKLMASANPSEATKQLLTALMQ